MAEWVVLSIHISRCNSTNMHSYCSSVYSYFINFFFSLLLSSVSHLYSHQTQSFCQSWANHQQPPVPPQSSITNLQHHNPLQRLKIQTQPSEINLKLNLKSIQTKINSNLLENPSQTQLKINPNPPENPS